MHDEANACPVCELYFPTEQELSELNEEAPMAEEYQPTGVSKHPEADEAPVTGLYFPAPHAVQDAEAGDCEK